MLTQKGDNVLVVGIHGNFDDAQTGVKRMFSDRALEEELARAGYQFSSANSSTSAAGSADRLLCVRLLQTARRRAHRGRREDQCDGSHGKLRKHSGGLLCEADGTSHRKADLRIQ